MPELFLSLGTIPELEMMYHTTHKLSDTVK